MLRRINQDPADVGQAINILTYVTAIAGAISQRGRFSLTPTSACFISKLTAIFHYRKKLWISTDTVLPYWEADSLDAPF